MRLVIYKPCVVKCMFHPRLGASLGGQGLRPVYVFLFLDFGQSSLA